MASKYALNPADIFKMNEDDLKSYIRKSSKVLNIRLKRTLTTGVSEFSELVYETEHVTEELTGTQSQKLSASVKGKSKQQLQSIALHYNKLSHITETAGQVKQEYERNIENAFKNRTYTKRFLESEKQNRKFLAKLVSKNFDFIYELLSSDYVQGIMNSAVLSPEEKYFKILSDAFAVLDDYEDEAKEEILKKWKVPEKDEKTDSWATPENTEGNDKW